MVLVSRTKPSERIGTPTQNGLTICTERLQNEGQQTLTDKENKRGAEATNKGSVLEQLKIHGQQRPEDDELGKESSHHMLFFRVLTYEPKLLCTIL
eukprot:5955456-Pleurochrysis_carterae.AAC.13